MAESIQTQAFADWLTELTDIDARAAVLARIGRLELGNAGDVAPVGDGISEMRIHLGPGYRVYFMQEGKLTIILLCGGDKSSQKRDIKEAKALAAAWRKRKEEK